MTDITALPAIQHEALGVTRTAILLLTARYGYVTNLQLARRRGSPKSESFYRAHTAALEAQGYLLRLHLPREQPAGQGRAVFTLTARGRKLLNEMEIEVRGRFRPSEERRKAGSLPLLHSVAVTDWLIAQDKLAEACPEVTLRSFTSERALKAEPLVVELPPNRQKTSSSTLRFAPDGWYSLALDMGRRFEFSYFLETDRGSEYQRQLRKRFAGYLAAARSRTIHQRFSPVMTVAFVTTAGATRLETLSDWCAAEIRAWTDREEERRELADLFRLTCADPAKTDPLELFFGSSWRGPLEKRQRSLIPAPDLGIGEEGS